MVELNISSNILRDNSITNFIKIIRLINIVLLFESKYFYK